VTAAVDLVAKTTERTVELAPAVMRDGVQRPAVLGLGWWQVASAAAMTGSEAASAMAEAVAVMVVASATALAVRRSLLDGVLADSDPTFEPALLLRIALLHTFEPVLFPPSNPFCRWALEKGIQVNAHLTQTNRPPPSWWNCVRVKVLAVISIFLFL